MTLLIQSLTPFLRLPDGLGAALPRVKDLLPSLKPDAPEGVTQGSRAVQQIQLTRHDHHNLELKSFIDPGPQGFQSWLEVTLFVPGSFQLSRWDKKELRSDFQSRTRLAISAITQQGNEALSESIRRLRECLEGQHALSDLTDQKSDLLMDAGRDLGAVVHETVRCWTSQHKRKCRLAFSLMNTGRATARDLHELCSEVETAAANMETLRNELAALEDSRFPILALLREYSGNLYLKYLSEIEEELRECPSERFVDTPYGHALHHFRESLQTLRQEEAVRQGSRDALIGEHERESQLVRLSQLKKFFQSKMFVDVSRHTKEKRIVETTAILGTALAGAGAAMFQRAFEPAFTEVTVSGVVVLAFGAFIYTLRDRIKDRLKVLLAKKALSRLAEAEHSLWVNGQRMGLGREWCRIHRGPKDLDTKLVSLRRMASLTEVEKELPEETFLWRRWQSVPNPTQIRGNDLAFDENSRINLERYLKFMDDPFKELADLNSDGSFSRFRSRRVYHFYLGIRSQIAGAEYTKPIDWSVDPLNESIYRIVLNKRGIARIELAKTTNELS